MSEALRDATAGSACSWVVGLQDLLDRNNAYGTLNALLLRWRLPSASARTRAAEERASRGRVDVSEEECVNLPQQMIVATQDHGGRAALVAQCLSQRRDSRIHLMTRIAREKHVPFVDVTTLYDGNRDTIESDPVLQPLAERHARIFGKALGSKPQLSYLLPDKCHPNAVLAEIVGRELAAIVERELLTRSGSATAGNRER